MPIITVALWKGRSTEQKTKLVEQVTKVTSEALNVGLEEVIVILQEYSKGNWAIGGKLSSTHK